MKFETKKAMKKLSELKFAPYNPRTMTERMKIKLKNSIDKFGYVEPIVWNKRTGNVVGGNQRLEVMRNSSQGKDPDIEVVVVDIPENEEKALNLALNKISGDWDTDKLIDVFRELDDDILDYTGFEEDEISKILDEDIEMKEDDFDVEKSIQKPKYEIKMGEIWKLGKHRIMCGDSTKKEDIEKLMEGKKADMVFTDPPYAIYGSSTGVGSNIADDKMVRPFFRDILYMIQKTTKWHSHIYICMDWRSYPSFFEVNKIVKLVPRNLIVWNKNNAGRGANYQPKHEFIFFLSNTPINIKIGSGIEKGTKTISWGIKNTNVWEFDIVIERKHGAQKPVELISCAINNSSEKDNIVLDLFGGSGSTLIACEQLNRKCYMMEIDPIYCDVIIERWEKFTGQKAKIVSKNGEKQKIQ